MKCISCEQGDKGLDEIAFARAMKTAHTLALQEAQTEYARTKTFTLPELYKLYLDRIYAHEYKRNMFIERERRSWKNYTESRETLCEYHGEFDYAFCEEVHKECEQKFAQSKWPNPHRF